MKLYLLFILILTLSITAFGQKPFGQIPKVAIKYPAVSSEYTVEFPAEPVIEQLYNSKGAAGVSARVEINGSFMEADIQDLSEEELKKGRELDEKDFADNLLSFVKNEHLSDVIVTTGRNALGIYADLRGYVTVSGIRKACRIISYAGSRQFAVLYLRAPSDEYPTKEIAIFLKSLKRQ